MAPLCSFGAWGTADGVTDAAGAAEAAGGVAAATTTAASTLRHAAPPLPNCDIGAEAWLPGFAYDLDVVLQSMPPLPGCSYADMAANRCQAQHRNALPLNNVLGAGFSSSSNEGEAVP
jgi:hypothetical protein